jgi:hypothetical protein
MVFIQRSRLGRSIFALRGDQLEITSHLFGRKSETEIPLRMISSNYEVDARRYFVLIIVPLLFAIGCITIFCLLLRQEAWPQMFAMYPAMFTVMFVWIALKHVPRVEYFTFTDHWKKPLFSIVRERAQSNECEAFIRELLERIERTEKGLSPVESPNTPVVDEDYDQPREQRWLLSILAGGVATGFPLISQVLPEVAALTLAVVLAATTCGLIAGVQSFIRKERMKYGALLGIALSVLPFVIY